MDSSKGLSGSSSGVLWITCDKVEFSLADINPTDPRTMPGWD